MTNRKEFQGPKRRLVLAFDLGTTFSGISYAILDPGKVPEVKTVTRHASIAEAGDSKIQTVIWYDKDGNVLAVGAEEPAEPPLADDASDDEWEEVDNVTMFKVEWFKLLLRPRSIDMTEGIPKPNLPSCKRDIIDIFADFYRYLYERALEGDIDFVLSHPNGWEGTQQSAMRRAAIKAELVPDSVAGRERVKFVTEGEASLHYCVSSGLVSDIIEARLVSSLVYLNRKLIPLFQIGKNVMIVDAGGGTVDLSTYKFVESAPILIREMAAPGCIFQGSVMVRQRASDHLKKKLENTHFGQQRYIDAMTEEFDKTTKKRFKGTLSWAFGAGKSNSRGQQSFTYECALLSLEADAYVLQCHCLFSGEVASFFDPAVNGIIQAIENQRQLAEPDAVSTIFLVGGFAASEYLYSELRGYLEMRGLYLFRPDNHTNKAVAEGAVSFHLDHFVSTRIARFTYGIKSHVPFDASCPAHQERIRLKYIDVDGAERLPNAFTAILSMGTATSEIMTCSKSFIRISHESNALDRIECSIICYKGILSPSWMDTDPDRFSRLCVISADLTGVPKRPQKGARGTYYRRKFDIELSFGLTELKAYLSWTENVRLISIISSLAIHSSLNGPPGRQEKVSGFSQCCNIVLTALFDESGPASVVYDDE
ncbi:hypothetical protein EW146_g9133 [Bondarzewia mesenterica]|uniref:Uncharacterized protein n=1 Tax=Bondarzewia mesenterica TaxID=1095465 RepID=A0A4V3XD16_9AGAM|nr:hypothetical protein EW146_g9133 [Bondarzewia mesenterica]